MFFRLGRFFVDQISLANVFVRALVFGVEAERRFVMLKGFADVRRSAFAVGVTQEVVHVGIARLLAHGLVQLKHGAAPVFGVNGLARGLQAFVGAGSLGRVGGENRRAGQSCKAAGQQH